MCSSGCNTTTNEVVQMFYAHHYKIVSDIFGNFLNLVSALGNFVVFNNAWLHSTSFHWMGLCYFCDHGLLCFIWLLSYLLSVERSFQGALVWILVATVSAADDRTGRTAALKAWYDAEAFLSWWGMVPPQPSHNGLEEFGEHRSSVNHKLWLLHGTSPLLGFDSGVMKEIHSIMCDQTISLILWPTRTVQHGWLWFLIGLRLLTSSAVIERRTWCC